MSDVYVDALYEIIHRDKMYDYEEVNMPFIAAKLLQLQFGGVRLILRSDFIEEETYWIIRYFRSKNVEPFRILSTAVSLENHPEGVLGIPIVTIGDLDKDNTKNCILIIINRESDRQEFTQKDYRESEYGFCFRARGQLQFARDRGIKNYYHILHNENKYYEVIKTLYDEESKKAFIEVIRSLIENDIYRYLEYPSEKKYIV